MRISGGPFVRFIVVAFNKKMHGKVEPHIDRRVGRPSQLLFGELAEFVGNGPVGPNGHLTIPFLSPAVALADAIDGTVGGVTGQTAPRSGTAFFMSRA